MSDTYLAVFVGSKTSAKALAWNALSETERKAKEKEGIAGWKAWAAKCPASENEIIEIRQVQEITDFPPDVQQAAEGFSDLWGSKK